MAGRTRHHSRSEAKALGHPGPFLRPPNGENPEGASFASPLLSHLRFFWAGVANRAQTGSLLPSQRFLVEKMLDPIPVGFRGQILELGPGTGALTLRLAARCPKANIMACEINPALARDLRANLCAAGLDGSVEVVSDSAERLLGRRRRQGFEPADFILSGIPLGNLARRQVLSLVKRISRSLRPGGMYIQFQYSLVDRKKIRACFSTVRTVPVLLNLPPAFIYYATR